MSDDVYCQALHEVIASSGYNRSAWSDAVKPARSMLTYLHNPESYDQLYGALHWGPMFHSNRVLEAVRACKREALRTSTVTVHSLFEFGRWL